MPRTVMVLHVLVVLLLSTGSGLARETRNAWRWGIAVGSPQVIAVTLERNTDAAVRGQFHAGTVLLLSSVGVRALFLSSSRGVGPYAYLGAGILHAAEGEGGGPLGATGYGWGGGGVRLRAGGLTWYGELGLMGGMDTGKGYEPWLPAAAVGVVFGQPAERRVAAR